MDLPTLTKHAIARALDMGVEGDEIRQALLHPERVRKSRIYKDTKNYTAGRISLAVCNNHVITVVWSSQELYDEDLSRGDYDGRTSRQPAGQIER